MSGGETAGFSELYKHTVPIIDYDRGLPSLTGTGVLVLVDHRRFVITAAHVLEARIEKVGFGYRDTNGFNVFGVPKMPTLMATAQSHEGNPGHAVYKDDLDLAIIEPPVEVADELQLRYTFYDLRKSADPPLAGWGVVSGWPERKNTYDKRRKIGHFNGCYHIQCPIVAAGKLPNSKWNPDIHVGLSADKEKDFASAETGDKIHLPSLEGMSGGGFWMPPGSERGWTLGGIVIEDDQPNRMLKVIKISYLWSPLGQHCGLAK